MWVFGGGGLSTFFQHLESCEPKHQSVEAKTLDSFSYAIEYEEAKCGDAFDG